MFDLRHERGITSALASGAESGRLEHAASHSLGIRRGSMICFADRDTGCRMQLAGQGSRWA
jgi:hypothetical protein